MKSVLYIFDETVDSEKLPVPLDSEANKIFVCPVTTDQGKIDLVLKKIRIDCNADIEVVPFVSCFNKKAFTIREEFIKFISDFADKPEFGGKNLKEYFRYPFKSFSLWWFSLIYEKNTSKTNAFHKFVKLLTVLDLRSKYNCKEIWLNAKDERFASALSANAKDSFILKNFRKQITTPKVFYFTFHLFRFTKDILFTLFRILFVKLSMIGLKKREDTLGSSKYILMTYFPLMDKESVKRNKFLDRYYQPLQRILEKKEEKVTWIAIDQESFDLSWKEGIKFGRKVNNMGHCLFFAKEWITFFDFLVLIPAAIFIMVKYFIAVPYLSRSFKYKTVNVDMWPLFKNDWYRSFSGWTLIEGMLFYFIFSRILKRLRDDAVVVYISENHAWEKALNAALLEKREVKSIGIQHSIVPLLLLNYFDYKEDLQEGDYVQKVPRPDYLACIGKITETLFLKTGWPKDKIFVLGAMRFQHLKHLIEKKISWESRENKIVVALSVLPEESKETLLYVCQAFKDQVNYKVIIKPHPLLSISRVISFSNVKFNKDIFEIVNTPLKELLPKAKALIVPESSAALEAIACQCPVIIPHLANIVDRNPLSGVSDLCIYAESPGELKEITDKIINAEESPLSYEKCRAFINEYFEFPNSDEEYFCKIEKRRIR